jgi:hypothetical protein
MFKSFSKLSFTNRRTPFKVQSILKQWAITAVFWSVGIDGSGPTIIRSERGDDPERLNNVWII